MRACCPGEPMSLMFHFLKYYVGRPHRFSLVTAKSFRSIPCRALRHCYFGSMKAFAVCMPCRAAAVNTFTFRKQARAGEVDRFVASRCLFLRLTAVSFVSVDSLPTWTMRKKRFLFAFRTTGCRTCDAREHVCFSPAFFPPSLPGSVNSCSIRGGHVLCLTPLPFRRYRVMFPGKTPGAFPMLSSTDASHA